MRIEKGVFYQRLLFTAFWIRVLWSFLADEILPIMHALTPIVHLAFDALILCMGIAVMGRKRDRVYAVVFVAVSCYITVVVNKLTLAFYANGLRDFFSYLFVIPIVNYFLSNPARKKAFVEGFDRQLYLFLLVQVPCVLYQFFLYGAGDMVGGSLGHWNSGVLTTMIFSISFYLMRKRLDPERYFMSLWQNKILILLLIPTQLNETKISFFYLLMYFLLLMPMNRKSFLRALAMIPALLIVIWLMGLAYVVSTGGDPGDMFSIEYYAETYLYDETGASEAYAEALFESGDDQRQDVPRFSKFMLLSDIHDENPGHVLTGFGLGQFKGGTLVENAKFYLKYQWMLDGTVPYAFHVWIQMGAAGIALMIWFFVNLFSAKQPGQRRDYNTHFFFVLIFIILMVYNDSIRFAYMCLPLAYIIMASWHDQEPAEEEDDGEEAANET